MLQPSSQVVEQRLGPCCANGATLIRRSPLDLLLDQVQRGDALDGFGGDGRVVRLHQIEKLAPDVRYARRLLNRTALVKLVESGKRVGLQYALELSQMLLRMFALAVRRVCKPHGRRGLVARGTVVADIGPEAAGLGLACSRCKYGQRSIVAVQLVGVEHITAHTFPPPPPHSPPFPPPPPPNPALQPN